MNERRISWSSFGVAGAVAILLYLGPILYLLGVALQSPSQFLNNPVSYPHPLAWNNFIIAWKEASMQVYFSNSLLYAAGATFLSLLLAVFVAFPVSRRYVRASNWIYLSFVAGMFLPVGLIPLFIESRMLDLYNNRIGYIILHLQYGLSFGFFIFAGYFRTIPRELDESAAIDGCGYFRYVFQILIPLVKPALATAGIYIAINVWNDLIGPVVFLASNSLFPLTRGLYTFYGSYQSEWTLLAAGVFIVAAPLIAAFLILQRYLVAGAISGSIKQ